MFVRVTLLMSLWGLFALVYGKESNSTSSCSTENQSCYEPKLICYFTNWSIRRLGKSNFNISNIDTSLCTHIVYSFAVLNSTTLKIQAGDPEIDIGTFKMYEKVTSLKSKGVKVLIALGGWLDSSNGTKYSQMINDGRSRTAFVHDTVEFLQRHNFQGLDLDWEYPKCWQGNCSRAPASDKTNFGTLIKELKTAFRSRGFLLTAAVSADKNISDKAYSVEKVSKYLDWIGIMTYDYHSAMSGKTGHHSPLMGVHPNTIDSIEYWLSKRVPANQVIMGIPFYGRSFTLSDNDWSGVGIPASIGKPAQYTSEAGFIAYFEFCTGWTYKRIHDAGSYAVKGDQWISYNDLELIQEKTEHVLQYKLGGIMIWAIDLDDFNGEFCGQGKYPMLTAIKNILLK